MRTIKFDRFNSKKRFRQLLITGFFLIFLILFSVSKVREVISNRRLELIDKYKREVVSLEVTKKVKLQKIEDEYSNKINILNEKIKDLEAKTK